MFYAHTPFFLSPYPYFLQLGHKCFRNTIVYNLVGGNEDWHKHILGEPLIPGKYHISLFYKHHSH